MQGAKYSTYDIRIRAVRAKLNGMSMNDVADAYQVNRSTVYRWMIRYRDKKEQGLLRCNIQGRPAILGTIKDGAFVLFRSFSNQPSISVMKLISGHVREFVMLLAKNLILSYPG